MNRPDPTSQKNFRIDKPTQKMLRDVHWYFEDQSLTIRTAIKLLYLYHKKSMLFYNNRIVHHLDCFLKIRQNNSCNLLLLSLNLVNILNH